MLLVVEEGIRILIYERHCLVLRKEEISRGGGGADVFWPCTPELVKLEIGKIGKEMRAHMLGTDDILLCICGRNSPAVGTGR